MKQTDFSRQLEQQGLVDSRAAVVFGVLDGPDGNGTCLACINGNTLRLVECGFDQKPQAVHHTIPLSEIQIVKASSFVFAPTLVFTHNGSKFKLKNFGAAKEFLAIVAEEAGK